MLYEISSCGSPSSLLEELVFENCLFSTSCIYHLLRSEFVFLVYGVVCLLLHVSLRWSLFSFWPILPCRRYSCWCFFFFLTSAVPCLDYVFRLTSMLLSFLCDLESFVDFESGSSVLYLFTKPWNPETSKLGSKNEKCQFRATKTDAFDCDTWSFKKIRI